jgi:hypothetical protein
MRGTAGDIPWAETGRAPLGRSLPDWKKSPDEKNRHQMTRRRELGDWAKLDLDAELAKLGGVAERAPSIGSDTRPEDVARSS